MDFFDEDSESEWSDDNQEVIGLFNNQKFDTVQQLIEDARNNYNFDFYGFQKKHKLDQYGCIRMINYIRSEIANKTNPETLVLSLLPKLLFLNDHKYYKPVLENDALLFSFDVKEDNNNNNNDNNNDDDDQKYNNNDDKQKSLKTIDESTNINNNDDQHRKISNKIGKLTEMIEHKSITSTMMEQENKSLRAINQQLNEQINEMKKTFHRIVLEEEYNDNKKQQFKKSTDNDDDDEMEELNKKRKQKDIDTYYFDSYSRVSVHEMMLRDRNRTLSYKDFIMGNTQFFKDKIVMDIGCGTGVLSIFAAKSGAKHVIAIDMSDIANKAKQIIKNNGFQDKITVIQEKVENIKSLPNGIDNVDIIISEWMGYFLLYESMLSSVLFARDKWLNKMENMNQIFPNQASLFMAGFDYDSMELTFWKNECYDIDMSVMYKRPTSISEPLIIHIETEYIYTEYACFKTLDMHTAMDKDLDFTVKFDLIGSKDGAVIDALVVWFDCLFENNQQNDNDKNIICLSTSPEKEVTHWYSTVFLLSERWKLNKSERIHVELNAFRCKENPREYSIFIMLSRDKDARQIKQLYHLNGAQPAK